MSNTGSKAYTTLEQYDVATNLATGVTKPNTIGDPDYVAPVTDTEVCPVPAAIFEVSPRKYYAPGEFSDFQLVITSSQSWTASFTGSWVTASALSGSGDGSITITVLKNNSGASRSLTIKIVSGGVTKYCTISQETVSFR